MKRNSTLLNLPTMTIAAAALCIAAGSAPALAQSERCADLYGRVMTLYQTAPYSPEYSRFSAYYSARCLAGPSAGGAYPTHFQAQYPAYQPQVVAVYPGGVSGVEIDDDRDDYRRGSARRYR